MFPIRRRLLVFVRVSIFALLAVRAAPLAAENWPQWRGPGGDGVSGEDELPIAWAEGYGIGWKCRLPEWGNSTPVVWDDAIFLTSHVDDERLVLLRIDKATGHIVWTRQVGTGRTPRAGVLRKTSETRRHQEFHDSHNLATPSPVTDGRLVVVHFGNGDLATYDFDGGQLWHRNLQQDHGDYTIWWGHGNSPVLHGNLVISVCMQDSCHDLPGNVSPSYLVAHDKQTGRQVWKTMRMTEATREHCDAYTTPIFRQAGDRVEMIVMGAHVLDAYDPAAGNRLWYLPGLVGNRLIPNPVAAHGMIYATQGMRGPLVAVKPGGDGQRSRDDILWKFDQGTSDSPSPVVWGEHLYFVTNNGIARCLDAQTGHLQWKERLKGEYRASPVAAEGRVYFLNMEGLTTVVSASARFDRLTENQLDDQTIASPAVSDGRIFIRGRKVLYCLRK
ncbi:MAG: PQQ-binding-like beta-propeller repeat protein [Pirellulales bacterium]|nr:PQQ-binding-like beta-propeller repeat protein [Pirellulales bacterium]